MDSNMSWKGIATAEELAERLKIGRSTVYDLVREGEIPHFRVGHSIRFDLAVIYQWLLEQMETSEDDVLEEDL